MTSPSPFLDRLLAGARCQASAALGRRAAQREARREGIIDVATRSFMELGYAGTTMTQIAAKLGGSKGTLWSYFPSKDLLFAAVLDRATQSVRAQLSQILNPDDDLEMTLRRYCALFLERLASPEALALYRLIIGEAGRFPEIGRIFYERGPQAVQKLLADYLELAMARCRLRPTNALEAAQLLMQMCLAGSHQRLLMGIDQTLPPERMNQDIDRALALFLRAYAVR